MRIFKRLATLTLSVALFGCSKESCETPNLTYLELYPITSQFDVSPKEWCISEYGLPELPYQQCVTYFVQAVVIKIYAHYNMPIPNQTYLSCFVDSSGQYGLIPTSKFDECLKIHNFEDIARPYGVR